MEAVEQISLTLPADMVARLRARVSAGDYANESQAVEVALDAAERVDAQVDAISPEQGHPEDEEWARIAITSAYDAYLCDPTNVFTLEEIRASLEEARRARR